MVILTATHDEADGLAGLTDRGSHPEITRRRLPERRGSIRLGRSSAALGFGYARALARWQFLAVLYDA